MHFVDEIDFVSALDRGVGDVIKQLARFFDTGTRGGIDFDKVGEAPLVDFLAVVAFAAGIGADVIFWQLSDLAKMRAMVVLPTPRVPVKR